MNLIDENFPETQRRPLRGKRVRVKQIGDEIGRQGMPDDEIIPLLHGLDRPTFFTLDQDFYDRRLCHAKYCLVHLDVDESVVAAYAHRVLRHRKFKSKAERMGLVIRVFVSGLTFWRIGEKHEHHLSWQSR